MNGKIEINGKETAKIVKAALYARVSTEEQKENFSLAAQIELLRKHAADNGYEIFDEYVDGGYSGTSYERPRFQRLMDDAKQGRINLILVYKVDRFFRSNKDLLNVVYELEGMGVNIRSITEPFDTTNYLGKFILSLFGSIAELERNTFLERSKIGKMRRAREGYYSGSSPAKFGYNYIKETKKLEINEKEAEAVRKIYEVYRQPDSSLIKTTRALRKLDYRAKEGSLMREDVVHDVLRDPIYTGRWYANRHGKNGTLKPREEWIEVKVPQIVSEEIFERSQELLEARKNYSERNAKYPYLLQGMVKCGDCGNTIAGTADKQFQIRDGKSYGPYFKLYYRCTHFAKNKYNKLVNCRLKYVQTQKLESAVWQKIEEILENPGLIEKAVRQEKEIKTKSEGTLKQDIERIDLQQQGLIKEEQRILEAYRHNIISLEQLKQQVEGITKSKEVLEKTKQEIGELLQQDNKQSEISSAIDYVKKLKEGIGKFTYETKKRILHLFNTMITVNVNGIIDILIHLPKDISAAFQPALSGSGPDILSHFDPPRPISW
ncbi:MAG: recombinase family protein [Candidatus Omnitrophota bacterium]